MRSGPTLFILLLSAVVLGAAACSGGGGGQEGGQAAASASATSSSAPASSPAPSRAEARGGSCADTLEAGSIAKLTCTWIADADVAVCGSMSDNLLSELFAEEGAAGIEVCKELIGGMLAKDDKSLIRFEPPTVQADRATLLMTDRSEKRERRYRFGYVRRGGVWAIDTVEQIEAAPEGGHTPAQSPEQVAATEEIRSLVRQWYANADPGVCDAMTDRMLDFGWGKTGASGRELCRTNIAKSSPVGSVKVRRPRISGQTAMVQVVYTNDGDRLIDQINLVRKRRGWLIDEVGLAGFAP